MKEYKVEINKKKNNLCDLRELIGRGIMAVDAKNSALL
jgi:hypothetical protein